LKTTLYSGTSKPVQYKEGEGDPIVEPHNKASETEESVSSEHLVPPTYSLRVWRKFLEKREASVVTPQLFMHMMCT